jgi:PleD family two-component response regulator
MLSAYFQVQGYEVASAVRGEDAVVAIGEKHPDIVVLDIHLPDIDGYEVCRRLRHRRHTRRIPVIFLTQKVEREDKLAGLELGAVDYITKPFDIQELRLRVRNTLRRASLGNLRNPVTGLPEGSSVLEPLERMLQQPEWAVVLAGIRGLDKFRDEYGFVTADDVSRAVTLMITNALHEVGGEDDFIGHADSGDFIIVTKPSRAMKLAERCLARLRPSVRYFYPAQERERLDQLPESERLTVRVATVDSKQHGIADVDSMFAALESNLL